MIVNQAQLVDILNRDASTLWEWQKVGMPVLEVGGQGRANRYDSGMVIEWLLERERRAAPKGTRDELLQIELRLKQMDLAERERTLVPAAEVKPLWENRVLTAAAFIAGRHSRLAAMLEASPGIEAKRALLKQEDANFLQKLGVAGDRMQGEVEALLATLPADQASAFLRRVAGDEAGQVDLATVNR